MPQFWDTHQKRSKNGVLAERDEQICASVGKTAITLTAQAVTALSDPDKVVMMFDRSSRQWAIAPAHDNPNAYAVNVYPGGGNRHYIGCGGFIKQRKLPRGLYVGTYSQRMLIFTNKPTLMYDPDEE